jgi:hypothetical protein
MASGATVHDAIVNARDASSILAIAGSLSLSISNGSSGGATAVSAGVAIAVNSIAGDTIALVSSSTLTAGSDSTGTLTVKSLSEGEIQAYTVAGALSAASSKQSGSGIGASGAGSGSVNKIDSDTIATIENSTITANGDVLVQAQNNAKITAGAGAVAIALGSAVGQGQAGAVAIGGSFSVNELDGDNGGNQVGFSRNGRQYLCGRHRCIWRGRKFDNQQRVCSQRCWLDRSKPDPQPNGIQGSKRFDVDHSQR